MKNLSVNTRHCLVGCFNAGFASLLMLTSSAQAQNNRVNNSEIEEVITIGSRMPALLAIESLVPVDVISNLLIQHSGAVDTADMLRKLAPSFLI